MNKGINLSKISCIIGIFALLFLEIVFANNAVNEVLISTGRLQLVLCFCAIISMLYSLFKVTDTVVLLGGILTCFMLLCSTLFISTNTDITTLIIKQSLWFCVFLLGYSFPFFVKKHDVIIVFILCTFVVLCWIYVGSLYSDYSIKNKNYVLTSIYYLICCFPFSYIIKNVKLKRIVQYLIVLLTCMSFKRSALLVVILSVMVSLISNRKQNIKNYKLNIGFILLSIVILVMLFIKINENGTTLSFVFDIWSDRVSTASSREGIYAEVINMLKTSSFMEFLFGHGYNAVMRDSMSGLSAHNDYLEVLYNYGLITFILFMLFIIQLLKMSKIIKQYTTNEHYNGYICSLTIFIVASIPSHMLTYSTYFLLLSLYWGYAIGLSNKNKYYSKEKNNANRDINLS